jgi:anti-sigma B factor antagonist
MMEIQEAREGDVVIVAPHGRLDPAAEGAFDRKLKALLDEQARFVVVDFGKVDYVGGGSLRALLLAMRRLGPRGGRLVLCRLNGVVQQAFALAGFDRVFTIVRTRADAVQAASGAPVSAALPAGVTVGVDPRVVRIAALALPLLETGDDAGRIAARRAGAEPPSLRAGLGALVCRVLA